MNTVDRVRRANSRYWRQTCKKVWLYVIQKHAVNDIIIADKMDECNISMWTFLHNAVLDEDKGENTSCLGRYTMYKLWVEACALWKCIGPKHMEEFATNKDVITYFRDVAMKRSSLPGICHTTLDSYILTHVCLSKLCLLLHPVHHQLLQSCACIRRMQKHTGVISSQN